MKKYLVVRLWNQWVSWRDNHRAVKIALVVVAVILASVGIWLMIHSGVS